MLYASTPLIDHVYTPFLLPQVEDLLNYTHAGQGGTMDIGSCIVGAGCAAILLGCCAFNWWCWTDLNYRPWLLCDCCFPFCRNWQAFADLATTESDCSSSKRGGDLGPFGRKQMAPPFEAVSRRLHAFV